MRPTLPTLDARNGVLPNAIIDCNFSLQSGVGTNGKNLFRGKLCRSALFASIAGAMLYSVSLICSSGIPAKIGNMVICWIAVIVAALMFWRGIAKKGDGNKARYTHQFGFVVFPQKNRMPAIFFAWRRPFDVLGFYCADIPMIRNLVNPLESSYRLPKFIHLRPHMLCTGIIPQRNMECQ